MDSKKILSLMDERKISYKVYHHPAVFTTEDADKYLKDVSFARCKNLFIKTRNGKSFYLVVLPENKRLDMKKAKEQLHCSSLTMASEQELEDKLGVKSGSVSPMNVLNDDTMKIPVVVDQDAIVENENVGVHPNDNTQTVVLKWLDLSRLLSTYGHVFEERAF